MYWMAKNGYQKGIIPHAAGKYMYIPVWNADRGKF